ncbi:alkaline-phosphatase-like protein, partial [Syncephalastrum racemosum]
SITDVSPPYGGYSRFSSLGLGESYLPIWMQKAGYSTHYIGKLMNEYSVNNYDNPTPKGFDYQDQLVDPYTYVYNTAVFSKNGQHPVYYNNTYQTDVIHAKAVNVLKGQRNETEKPFFLWVSPMAPHAQFKYDDKGNLHTESPIPAARHKHLFKDVKLPRTPNFNPSKLTKTASYWKTFPQRNQTLVDEFDELYRDRLRALQAVDEMIGSLIEELDSQGKLDNTYIIYSADNGYHIGQHRASAGKATNIEEDINVPFIVRGPGVKKNSISSLVSAHHDIAPTLVALATDSKTITPAWVDGGVIPLTKALAKHPHPVAKESFAVEYWSLNIMGEVVPISQTGPNTYKTLRLISEDYDCKHLTWYLRGREI